MTFSIFNSHNFFCNCVYFLTKYFWNIMLFSIYFRESFFIQTDYMCVCLCVCHKLLIYLCRCGLNTIIKCKIIFHYFKKKIKKEASIILLNDIDVISCNNHLFSKCKTEALDIFWPCNCSQFWKIKVYFLILNCHNEK